MQQASHLWNLTSSRPMCSSSLFSVSKLIVEAICSRWQGHKMAEPRSLSYHSPNALFFLWYDQEINLYCIKSLYLGCYTLQTLAVVNLTNTSSLSNCLPLHYNDTIFTCLITFISVTFFKFLSFFLFPLSFLFLFLAWDINTS